MRYKGYIIETFLRTATVRFRLGYEPMLFRNGNNFVNNSRTEWGSSGSMMLEDLHEGKDGIWMHVDPPSAEEIAGTRGLAGRARETAIFCIPETHPFFNVDLTLSGLDELRDWASGIDETLLTKDIIRNLAIKYLESIKS